MEKDIHKFILFWENRKDTLIAITSAHSIHPQTENLVL